MKVIDKKPVPIYEVVCPECHSKVQYRACEVAWSHITCPICGVSMWANSICPVKYQEVDMAEIVYCEDCRYANECSKSVQYTRNEPSTVTIGYSPIKWCSKGKRRIE